MGFPGGSDGKASACSAGDLGLTPGLGRSPGEGSGSPLQYSCLEKPMDGGAITNRFSSNKFKEQRVPRAVINTKVSLDGSLKKH